MTKVEELQVAVQIEIDRLTDLKKALQSFVDSRSGPARLPRLILPQAGLPTKPAVVLPLTLAAVKKKKRKYTKKSKFWGKKKK